MCMRMLLEKGKDSRANENNNNTNDDPTRVEGASYICALLALVATSVVQIIKYERRNPTNANGVVHRGVGTLDQFMEFLYPVFF